MFQIFKKKDYSSQSDRELLSNFRSENWSKLRPNARLSIVREVEKRNASMQGREPCTVKRSGSKDEYGCYDRYSNKIEINVSDKVKNEHGEYVANSSYDALDTIYHEGEHAHQQNCIKNNIESPQGLPKTTRDMCEVENSKGIYKGVIRYENSTKEIDSNNAAAKQVMESNDLFADDPEYNTYLDSREQYFERVSNKDMSEVHMQQNEAVYQAYTNKDISLEKHDEILTTEVHKDQPAFEESKQISKKIKELKARNNQQSDEKTYARTANDIDDGVADERVDTAEQGNTRRIESTDEGAEGSDHSVQDRHKNFFKSNNDENASAETTNEISHSNNTTGSTDKHESFFKGQASSETAQGEGESSSQTSGQSQGNHR